jgi:hypothetical protein
MLVFVRVDEARRDHVIAQVDPVDAPAQRRPDSPARNRQGRTGGITGDDRPGAAQADAEGRHARDLALITIRK